jgi:hypothetical protein
MKKSLDQLENEILALYAKRLSGLRDGTELPGAYWKELWQAMEKFEVVYESQSQDSPQ